MIKTHAFRLQPGDDLKKGIQAFVLSKKMQAGWISCGVGSLTNYHIRFANQQQGNRGTGHFEVLSLTGTVSVNGLHIHISISDSNGKTIGGHLLDENYIYTTAEIIIQETSDFVFTREKDETTSWKELKVRKLNNKD